MLTNWTPFGHPIIGLVSVVLQVVQIVLWYLDSGCSRHMTGDCSKLINYVDKFIGTVRFGNDEFATKSENVKIPNLCVKHKYLDMSRRIFCFMI